MNYVILAVILLILANLLDSHIRYLNKAAKLASTYEIVKLCKCGKFHYPLERRKNICSLCKRNIIARGPTYFHPEKRRWVYGNREVADRVNGNFKQECLSKSESNTPGQYGCNLCGKLKFPVPYKRFNATYCGTCDKLIEDTKP